MFFILSYSCLCTIYWSQVLSREWRCSWSSADRRCSNYIWMINNFVAYWGAPYSRGLMVYEIAHSETMSNFVMLSSQSVIPQSATTVRQIYTYLLWFVQVQYFSGLLWNGKYSISTIFFSTSLDHKHSRFTAHSVQSYSEQIFHSHLCTHSTCIFMLIFSIGKSPRLPLMFEPFWCWNCIEYPGISRSIPWLLIP